MDEKPPKAKKRPARKKRKSTTGTRNPVVDQSRWRKHLQTRRIKFDDRQKGVFLSEYAEHNLKGVAAEAAGISWSTVRNHIDIDPEFAEMVEEAEREYRDKVVAHAQKLVMEGEEHIRYDTLGNVTEIKHVYPIRLIELELKRVDPTYRDKPGQVDITNNVGGVIISPPDMTPEEWVKMCQERNNSRERPKSLFHSGDADDKKG